MEAWTSASTPTNYLERRSPLERQGTLVFHNKQCINCHSIGGEGGLRGPALDSVATRLTSDQLVRQVIQGSGNMPAYGKNLTPAEVAALVSFMSTLHKSGEVPARDTTQPQSKTAQSQSIVTPRSALARK
jgi:ubiquinol-cytochrome c reductase cytochrome b subunit